jgi:uncharacterized membrane protein YkoI
MLKLMTFFAAGVLATVLGAALLGNGILGGSGAFANATCEEDWDDIGDDADEPGEIDDADCDANGLPIADGSDDDADDVNDGRDVQLSGTAYEKAAQAALAHVGGGTVTDTETGDDGAAYGVEIRLANGREVEVSLDANFNVISVENDD